MLAKLSGHYRISCSAACVQVASEHTDPEQKPVFNQQTRDVRLMFFNPLSPLDASKHHFTSLRTDLIFLQLRVLEFHETGLRIHGIFFFPPIKSSSSTTSRELRQQFAACSGGR